MKCEILDPKTAPNRTWRWRSSRSVAPCITLRRAVGCLFSNSARAIPISLKAEADETWKHKSSAQSHWQSLEGTMRWLAWSPRTTIAVLLLLHYDSQVLSPHDQRPTNSKACTDMLRCHLVSFSNSACSHANARECR